MFKRAILKFGKGTGKICFRLRHKKTLCPYPSDFSKVDKVTICGASNLLGQYLAFLLKRQEIIREITLYDDCNVRGLALDLEHMNTKTKVKPNSGDYALTNALKLSDIVIITNGFEEKTCSDEESVLKENASMIYKYAIKIASTCPDAFVCIITPPINIMVPVFSEAAKVCKAYNPNKIFGVSSLMEMRASSIVGDYLSLDPAGVHVPVVGGITPQTMVPLFSHARPYNEFSEAEIRKLTNEILEIPGHCRKLHTSAPLSTAYAVTRFILTLGAALCNSNCAKQTAFVRSNVLPNVKYFASEILISTQGAVANYGLPKIHEYELEMLSIACGHLEKDLEKSQILFDEIHRQARRDEIEEICKPKKPFIPTPPCPTCPVCIPTDICPESYSENHCCHQKSEKLYNLPLLP